MDRMTENLEISAEGKELASTQRNKALVQE